MKKIITLCLIVTSFLGLLPFKAQALNNTGYYVVTAYYSPLPNQDFYLTGNYTAEKRLNGEGIRWASWKEVFSWMLAWPSTYAFGTKIYIEWLWVWEIADRWGAIVTAWNRGYTNDRIDIWVWYWDDWLKRALYWWKRTVKGYIVDSSTSTNLDYYDILAPTWTTTWLAATNDSVFSFSLWIWSDATRIKNLQSFLIDLGLYTWEANWVYTWEIIDLVYNFQLENNIVSWPGDAGAWYWWELTRDKFKKAYLNGDFDMSNVEITKEEKTEEIIEVVENNEEVVEENNLSIFDSNVTSADEIRELQSKLTDLWLYNWEINWSYNDLIDPIYDFQIAEWIVTWIYTPWAWSYWPQTRAALKEKYKTYIYEQENKEEIERQKAIEKQKELERQKELEEKYKQIEKYAENLAVQKVSWVWYLKQWDVSSSVRELQNILKELGYFTSKDTAIFWNITNQSVIDFQVSTKVIDSHDEVSAGMVWPKTNRKLTELLKNKYLTEKLEEENIDVEEFVNVTWNELEL